MFKDGGGPSFRRKQQLEILGAKKMKAFAGREHSTQINEMNISNAKHFWYFDGVRNWITWSKPTQIWREHVSPHTNASVRFEQC